MAGNSLGRLDPADSSAQISVSSFDTFSCSECVDWKPGKVFLTECVESYPMVGMSPSFCQEMRKFIFSIILARFPGFAGEAAEAALPRAREAAEHVSEALPLPLACFPGLAGEAAPAALPRAGEAAEQAGEALASPLARFPGLAGEAAYAALPRAREALEHAGEALPLPLSRPSVRKKGC